MGIRNGDSERGEGGMEHARWWWGGDGLPSMHAGGIGRACTQVGFLTEMRVCMQVRLVTAGIRGDFLPRWPTGLA